ncbi:filamentation protein [Diplocarpon rosae]|nr:filamentation protein [Diplocarpon rosae]
MSRERSKAAQYIQQLDEARCEGNWEVVPELIRKVRKHAPQRTCLVITAEAEHAVAQGSRNHPGTVRPSTARTSNTATTTGSSRSSSISRFVPLLLEAIEKEKTFAEDEFQAQVCLGWLHWQLDEPTLAVQRLPASVEQDFSQFDGTSQESAQWTKACALKALYIKGQSQQRAGAITDALDTFESGLPILMSASSNPKQGNELRLWMELYLTGFCILSSHAIKSKVSPTLETETLSAFRAWAALWENQASAPTGGRAFQAEVSRRFVWKEYYITLSDLLQQDLPFPTTSLTTAYAETSTRLQQRAELKKVEARYETLLLSEVLFPKAEEASEEVETFVELVMQNWRILCGSGWNDRDLGEGGAEAVSRGVLDILYRAATKTFHSTAILRHLFTVHLAVAEFDIAFKAFDTYLDLIKKGKARVEKTGELERGLDDDEMVLKVTSACIKALCRYGSLDGAEKAKAPTKFLEDWLDKHQLPDQQYVYGHPLENKEKLDLGSRIPPNVISLAWRSVGIAHAQWARLSYEASTRSDIQLHAIKCLRKALLPQYNNTADVESLFALGMILAERRELPAAIEVVKSGLLPRSSAATSKLLGPPQGQFARERSLIPLWHLMALLLSARQEFVTAARSCEGAFEQFQDPKYLFGEAELDGTSRRAHLNEKATSGKQGVVDDMDDLEKEGVLEVKMTQLAIIEVLEGPEAAVNASDELLSLYTRLFGDPLKDSTPLAVSNNVLTVAPQSSTGTFRSVKSSIFGRSGRSVRLSHMSSSTVEEAPGLLPRPQSTYTTASSMAPTIHVTTEKGSAAKQHHHEKLQKRSESVWKKNGTNRIRSGSTARKRNSSGVNNLESQVPITVDGEHFFTPPSETEPESQWLPNQSKGQVGNTTLSKNLRQSAAPSSLPPQSEQIAHTELSLKSHRTEPFQDGHSPHAPPYSSSITPVTRFPKDQEKRRRSAILVKVWILISGFYRRASFHDDAKGALEEADKLVQKAEAEVLADTTGNVSINNAGWVGGKHVQQLWGDVFAERGFLALAQNAPYNALAFFESALTHFPDHPSAIVGLSTILLDIYTGDLLPPPPIPALVLPGPLNTPSSSTLNASPTLSTPLITQPPLHRHSSRVPMIPYGPLGLPSIKAASGTLHAPKESAATTDSFPSGLQPSYKESSTAFLDRLAARDRAYGLLTGLTKLGTGWNYSEAWFALSRAYEEGGQADKAREVLWWCVELEEARGVRDWNVAGGCGYVL